MGICVVLLGNYFDFVPTIRDLTSEPKTETYSVVVQQSGSKVTLETNTQPIKHFKMSMFEVLRDEAGERIFTPYMFRLFQKKKFSAVYSMTIRYYPHSGTRVEITDICEQ